jgi:hypothetical protein
MYLRHSSKLLDDSSPSDSDAFSNVHTVVPSDLDGLGDARQEWHAFIVSSQSGGAESPTTDVVVESSFDGGNNWAKVAGIQLTGDGSKTQLVELSALGPHVRTYKKLGGGTKPSSSALVLLASNGMYRIQDLGS